ncbi:MAG: hypothetical protein JO199_01735 [Candidatus Eremiobacteraeota bacterium]|nr:hypothetical protein [Candidatus Eremiobacteraeota bacterium]
MFRDVLKNSPLVADLSDINLRLRVTRADSKLFKDIDQRLPSLRVW